MDGIYHVITADSSLIIHARQYQPYTGCNATALTKLELCVLGLQVITQCTFLNTFLLGHRQHYITYNKKHNLKQDHRIFLFYFQLTGSQHKNPDNW